MNIARAGGATEMEEVSGAGRFWFPVRRRASCGYPALPRSKVHHLVSDIGSDIRHDSRRARRSFYVVKLVPADLPGQLPNFNVERSSHLKPLVAFLDAHSGENYVEAWYCRTRIDAEVFSVAGRIVFSAANAGSTQPWNNCGEAVLESWRPIRMILNFRM